MDEVCLESQTCDAKISHVVWDSCVVWDGFNSLTGQ